MLETVLKAILEMPGVHPAFFLLLVLGFIWVVKELRASEKNRREEFKLCSDQAGEAYEKRIAEQARILVLMEKTNTALATMDASVQGRTQAINELIQGFAQLVHTNDMSRQGFKDQANRLEDMLKDLTKASK